MKDMTVIENDDQRVTSHHLIHILDKILDIEYEIFSLGGYTKNRVENKRMTVMNKKLKEYKAIVIKELAKVEGIKQI